MQFFLVPVQFWVSPKTSVDLFVFPPIGTPAAKIHFSGKYLLLRSLGCSQLLFAYKNQESRFGAGQGKTASCNMTLWAKFHTHSSHWDPNTGNICFQIEHRMCLYCYWNGKGHELWNIIPLVRVASSTCVQWSEIISLNHLFSTSTMVQVAMQGKGHSEPIKIGNSLRVNFTWECWLQLCLNKQLPTSWKRSTSFWSRATGRLVCWDGLGQLLQSLSCTAIHLNSG